MRMNEQITVNLNNLTEEEREQFKTLVDKGRGKSSRESCVSIADFWNNVYVDKDRWKIGNIFKTEKEADFAKEKAKVKRELERYALEHNDSEKEAWDGNNFHFEIACGYLSKECICVSTNTGPYRGESITYFTSKEIAEGAIKSVGKDRILKYLFGVDCEEETND